MQDGKAGIAPNIEYLEPFADSPVNKAAAIAGLEGALDWFADPLFFGDYPDSLKTCAEHTLGQSSPRGESHDQGQHYLLVHQPLHLKVSTAWM